MKNLHMLTVLAALLGSVAVSPAFGDEPLGVSPGMARSEGSVLGPGLLGPAKPDAYGPGINSDATGRPFVWKPDFGGPALGTVKPNAYGPGVGMDATGRPVRPVCPPGWAGPC